MLGLTRKDMDGMEPERRRRVRKAALELMKECVGCFRMQGLDAASIARRLSREMGADELRGMAENMLVIGEDAVSVVLYELADDAEEEAGYAYLAVKGGGAS